MTSNKDVNKLIKEMCEKGWTATRGKHVKLRSPHGNMVVISLSPSCCYALKNIQGDIRRIEKKEAELCKV